MLLAYPLAGVRNGYDSYLPGGIFGGCDGQNSLLILIHRLVGIHDNVLDDMNERGFVDIADHLPVKALFHESYVFYVPDVFGILLYLIDSFLHQRVDIEYLPVLKVAGGKCQQVSNEHTGLAHRVVDAINLARDLLPENTSVRGLYLFLYQLDVSRYDAQFVAYFMTHPTDEF